MAKFQPWAYADSTHTRITVDSGPTKNPKKMTGTRLGAIAGVNKYKTDFGAWCEICRVAEDPFVESKYTRAGIAIEPALIEWCKENVSPYIVTPEQWFGTSEKLYDHFPNEPVFGGMWDALVLDKPWKGTRTGVKIVGVVEAKTSSRPQDWVDGVPASYGVQGLSYAYLLDVTRVFVPVAFLDDEDYDHPEQFVCTDANTQLYELRTSDSDIVNIMSNAMAWYEAHVVGNISPAFNESLKADKTFLDILRKSEVKHDGLETMAKEAAILEAKIEAVRSKSDLDALEKSLKTLKDKMKPEFVALFTENDDTVAAYGWRVKKSERSAIDKEKMAADDVLEKYSTITVTYTMSKEKV